MSEPEIIVVADPEAASVVAAERIAASLADAVAARGRADWATTGGTTPIGIYQALSRGALRDIVPWPDVHVWWGDDRFVPRDHPLSNVKALDDILLQASDGEEGTGFDDFRRVELAIQNLHPFPTGAAIGESHGADWAAAQVAGELRAAGLPASGDGWPVLDIVLLGMGADGHLLSVFPGSAAFESSAWAMAIPAPTHIEPHVERVTLNPAILGAARQLVVVVVGAGKSEILGTVLGSDVDVRRWPAQLARRSGATWILDGAAAANLPA